MTAEILVYIAKALLGGNKTDLRTPTAREIPGMTYGRSIADATQRSYATIDHIRTRKTVTVSPPKIPSTGIVTGPPVTNYGILLPKG